MNESPSQYEISDQMASLRLQLFILMLALVVVTGTLVAYLFYQSRIMSKSVDAIKPQAGQLIQTYNNKDLPVIQAFVKQLVAYGQAHPDFQQQVLKKYGITPQTVGAAK